MIPLQYRTTDQGAQTRALLLQNIHPGEELTRDELIQRSGLTYGQVQRQTRNLHIEGVLVSRKVGNTLNYSLRGK